MSEFQGAGRKPGLEVWRIEKMVPKMWADIGKFCTGDSYIVLKTSAIPGKSAYEWDIHFWLGAETSQDEAGVAAYKTVELDDYLGGSPVQHREVQDSESDKFLSYFKGGIQYVAGGVESGFTKVERDVYETRLLHLKGSRVVRVSQVPVSASSMNSGDVFILDQGLTIYQWNGKEANKKEKAKGLDVTTAIKNDERGGRAKVFVFDEGQETADFWTALGGKGAIKPASAVASDDKHEAAADGATKLLRVSDASGSVSVTEVASGTLKKAFLDTNDVFLVDTGAQLFVWVGKGANPNERKNAMVLASQYLDQNGRSKQTQITKINESGETPLFKQKFSDWTDARLPTDFSKPPQASVATKIQAKDIDFSSLVSAPNPADTPVDDGSGKLKIWRVEKFELVAIPQDLYGQFYAGDSYVILYTYKQGTKECYIVYFWLGRNSSQDEKGAAALQAKKVDDDLHGAATQVRVVQGKEPVHFLTLFKGKMVIHSGGTASGFKNKADADSYDTDGISLFHVKGTNKLNVRAVQVAEEAASLNSGDAFLLRTPDTVFAWFGKGCNEDEQKSALAIGDVLKSSTVFRTVTPVKEGEEPAKFWQALGGPAEYPSSRELESAPRDPRLFHLSNATGYFRLEEVFDFSQDDLDNEDVFILDVFSEVYLWVGANANAAEKKAAPEMAAKYLEACNDGRTDTPILFVNAGSEPPMFTSAFLGWDSTKATAFEDPYEKKLRELAAQRSSDDAPPVAKPAPTPAAPAANAVKVGSKFFSLAELQSGNAPIDQAQKEQYLSDEDFMKVFKMDKAKFAGLKGWRQEQLKKDAKLW